jgi:hypothetical protein
MMGMGLGFRIAFLQLQQSLAAILVVRRITLRCRATIAV